MPIMPDWATGPVQAGAQRVSDLYGVNPYDTVAPAHSLQMRAEYDTADLGGYDGNFGMATDLTRNAADMGWLQPQMNAGTPFASGGKTYDYFDRYTDRYVKDVVDSSEADLDAYAGRVRAQQALDLAGAGAFGGSGAALTQSMTEGELARGRASTLSALRSRGFETALSAAAGDADRATQARIANAQTALQDRAQKAGFGFQARDMQMRAGDQLAGIASGLDANRRANIAARAQMGDALRDIENEQRQAPLKTAEQITAMLSGLPLGLFQGKNEQGVSTENSVVKEKGKEISVSVGGGG